LKVAKVLALFWVMEICIVKMMAGGVSFYPGASLYVPNDILLHLSKQLFLTFEIASVHMYHNTKGCQTMMDNDAEYESNV
jgi:hypothetical protein